jgi:hypothetical protein
MGQKFLELGDNNAKIPQISEQSSNIFGSKHNIKEHPNEIIQADTILITHLQSQDFPKTLHLIFALSLSPSFKFV